MLKIHIVQKGDTLWTIAKKYGVSFEELKKINSQLSNPEMIMPGMKIKIPGAGGNVKKGPSHHHGHHGHHGKEIKKFEHPYKESKPPSIPIAETPGKVLKKEVPKEKPHHVAPIMPQPIVPDIEINQHFDVTMEQMNKQISQQTQKEIHKVPPNIFPGLEESVEFTEEKESSSHHHQIAQFECGGNFPYVSPYYTNCYPAPVPFYPYQPQWSHTVPVVQPAANPVYHQPSYPYGLPGAGMNEPMEESSSALLPFTENQAPGIYPPGAYGNQPNFVPISPVAPGTGYDPYYGASYPGAVYPPMPNQMPNQPMPNQMPNQPMPNQMPNQPMPNQMPNQPMPNQMPNQPMPNQMPNQPMPYQQAGPTEGKWSNDCHCQDQSGQQIPSYPGGTFMPVQPAPYQPLYPQAPYGFYGQPSSGPAAPYGEQGYPPASDQNSDFRTSRTDDESHDDDQ